MKKIKINLVIAMLCLLASNVNSQTATLRKSQFLLEKGLAISGHDPVSYFNNGPKKGKNEIAYLYEGIKYLFSSESNKTQFMQNPEKFEPQYGGWCAYAMGNTGEKVEIDPETYKILNGKLYLFFHPFYKNTLTQWNKDEKSLKLKADKNWMKFVSK